MTRVERWERRTDVPLILLALAFLVAYAVPVIHPDLDPGVVDFFNVVSWTVWAAFALDFAIRLALAEKRLQYAVKHWYDVALIALPLLRPLRLLRLVALFRVLDRSVGSTLAGRALVYAVGAATFAVFMGALAVLDAERTDSHANITNLGDALWWAGRDSRDGRVRRLHARDVRGPRHRDHPQAGGHRHGRHGDRCHRELAHGSVPAPTSS